MKVQEDQEKKIELIRDELYRRDPGPPSPPKFFDMKGGDDFPAHLMKVESFLMQILTLFCR